MNTFATDIRRCRVRHEGNENTLYFRIAEEHSRDCYAALSCSPRRERKYFVFSGGVDAQHPTTDIILSKWEG